MRNHLRLEKVAEIKLKPRKPKSNRFRVPCPKCPSKIAELIGEYSETHRVARCVKCGQVFDCYRQPA